MKQSAHSQSPAILQSLCCLAFLSLEDGFRRLSAHRLDGEGWKEKCNRPIGGPAANSSFAAVQKRDGGVVLRWWPGDSVPGHLYGRLLGVNSPMQRKQTCRIDLCPVAELSPLPQAQSDTSRACSLHSSPHPHPHPRL